MINLKIRKAVPSDRFEISKLFRDTINNINSDDYSRGQIEVWSRQVDKESFWIDRFKRLSIWVAEPTPDSGWSARTPLFGFIELSLDGELDCLYVHSEAQGLGVGRQLMDFICDWATSRGILEIFADVSVTARPFFERMKFEVVKKQFRKLEGHSFLQFRMQRVLAKA